MTSNRRTTQHKIAWLAGARSAQPAPAGGTAPSRDGDRAPQESVHGPVADAAALRCGLISEEASPAQLWVLSRLVEVVERSMQAVPPPAKAAGRGPGKTSGKVARKSCGAAAPAASTASAAPVPAAPSEPGVGPTAETAPAPVPEAVWKFDAGASIRALTLLGKHLGLFSGPLEQDGGSHEDALDELA